MEQTYPLCFILLYRDRYCFVIGVMEKKKKKEKLLHKQRKIFTGNKTLTSIERLIHADFIYIIGRIKQDKTMDGKTRESNTLMKILRSI